MTTQVGQRDHLTRRQGSRQVRSRFSIFSEGTRTERDYFELLRKTVGRGDSRNPLPLITFNSSKGSNPLQLVELAIREVKFERAPGDEVWCVFDVESPQQHPYIDDALLRAATKDISCAVSNPSFELWLILHFEQCKRHLSTDEACRRLESLLRGYSRHNKGVASLDEIQANYDVARARAVELESSFPEDTSVAARNPSTSVWSLTERLLNLRKSRREPA